MKSAKQRKKIATREEQDVAKALGGRRTFASGSGDFEKGDGIVRGRFAIENKTTDKNVYVLRSLDWLKIHDYAANHNLEPLFVVRVRQLVGYQRVVVIRRPYADALGAIYRRDREDIPEVSKTIRLYCEDLPISFRLKHMQQVYPLVALTWEYFQELAEKEIE